MSVLINNLRVNNTSTYDSDGEADQVTFEVSFKAKEKLSSQSN